MYECVWSEISEGEKEGEGDREREREGPLTTQ